MIVLKIYLISTAASMAVDLFFSIACSVELKRRGYKYTVNNKSGIVRLLNVIKEVFLMSLPVINVLTAATMILMGDKIIDRVEEKLLEDGVIYIPKNELLSIEPEIKDATEVKSVTIEKELNNNGIQNINIKIKYNDASIDYDMNDDNDLNQDGPTLKHTYNANNNPFKR